jgi:hypothetical protein
MSKTYLGDGVYVDFDGYQLVLTAENGVSITNTIYLEPAVYGALVAYTERLEKGNTPVPDINNHLLVPLEQDDQCPNCHNGTLEKQGPDVYVCRGECGAFFRGPCPHLDRNLNGGCTRCGDPSL